MLLFVISVQSNLETVLYPTGWSTGSYGRRYVEILLFVEYLLWCLSLFPLKHTNCLEFSIYVLWNKENVTNHETHVVLLFILYIHVCIWTSFNNPLLTTKVSDSFHSTNYHHSPVILICGLSFCKYYHVSTFVSFTC